MVTSTNSSSDDTRQLADFLNAASSNEKQICDLHPKLLELLTRLNQSFMRMLSGEITAGRETPSFLVLSAHAYFLAAVRIALGGQMPPVFPLLRASIEAVVFGYLMSTDVEKIGVWTDRHASDEAKKKCRKTFTGPAGIAEISKKDLPLGQVLQYYYDHSIEVGAHPNAGAVLPHLDVTDAGDQWLVRLRCIHPADSTAVYDTLVIIVASGCCILAAMSYVLSDEAPAHRAYRDATEISLALGSLLNAEPS